MRKLVCSILISTYGILVRFCRSEVRKFAEYLQFDLPEDEDLLWIAAEGFHAPLPEGWSEQSVTSFSIRTGVIHVPLLLCSWLHADVELTHRDKHTTTTKRTMFPFGSIHSTPTTSSFTGRRSERRLNDRAALRKSARTPRRVRFHGSCLPYLSFSLVRSPATCSPSMSAPHRPRQVASPAAVLAFSAASLQRAAGRAAPGQP